MDAKHEIWECSVCGSPCRLDIAYEETDLPKHVKLQNRFVTHDLCPCNQDQPEWRRVTVNNQAGEV